MEMEVEPDSINEKNDFLNRQDMAIGCILYFISPKILHQIYDDSQEFTLNDLWIILEVLFGNKKECMQNVDKTENVEKPLEDKSSQFEEPSTQVSTKICIPIIEDDVYSISNLFSEIHVEDIGMHLRSHMQTLLYAPCMHLRSQKGSRAHQIPL
jgi:hypothetical protein